MTRNDPIFALIAQYEDAVATLALASEATGAVPDDSPHHPAALALWWKLARHGQKMLIAMLTTAPTTLAGAAALLNQVGRWQFDDPDCGETVLSGAMRQNDEDLRRAAFTFAPHLAAVMHRLSPAAAA